MKFKTAPKTAGLLVAGVLIGAVAMAGLPKLLQPRHEGAATAAPQATIPQATARSVLIDSVRAPKGGFDPQYVHSRPVVAGTLPMLLPISGKLAFNAERTQQASARVAGRLDRILVFEGAHVTTGQPLAALYSADYISAQNEYLLASRTARTLAGSGMADLAHDAQETLAAARNRLRVLGASAADIDRLARSGLVETHLLIRAPINGIVVKRNMDSGAFLNVGDGFESISDPSRLWFVGNVFEQDYSKVRRGQTLQLQTAAYPQDTFVGRLDYIAPGIDPATHTLPIRCNVENARGLLRPEMFTSAQLRVGDQTALLVPRSALVKIEDNSYVIVARADGVYKRVLVKAVPDGDQQMAILSGLSGHEQVVDQGALLISHLIDSQQG